MHFASAARGKNKTSADKSDTLWKTLLQLILKADIFIHLFRHQIYNIVQIMCMCIMQNDANIEEHSGCFFSIYF